VAGTTMPTGDVSLIVSAGNAGGGRGTLNGLSPDVASFTTTTLPGSNGASYTVHAHYAGDGTFAPSDDPTGVSVTVNKEASKLQAAIVTFDVNTGNIAGFGATNFPYGSPYILRFDILNSTGTATNCQLLTSGVSTGCAFDATGTVMNVTDNGATLGGGSFGVNSQGHAEDLTIQLLPGTHNI